VEIKQRKGEKRFSKKREDQPVSTRRQIHPAEIIHDGKIERIMDEHFGMNSRQSAALCLGKTVGNRNLQRLTDNSSTSEVSAIQRSVVQRGIVDWFKKKLGSDPEGTVRNIDSGLDKASKVLDSAAPKIVDNPAVKKKLGSEGRNG
jgi:hypothetical protein